MPKFEDAVWRASLFGSSTLSLSLNLAVDDLRCLIFNVRRLMVDERMKNHNTLLKYFAGLFIILTFDKTILSFGLLHQLLFLEAKHG